MGRKNRQGRRRPEGMSTELSEKLRSAPKPTAQFLLQPYQRELWAKELGRCNGPLFGPLPIRKEPKTKARGGEYRRRLKRATPKWANKAAIRKLYEEAKVMTRATGLRYTVDHVIPLRGETVCGLHVHNNLQVILHEDNIRKGNTFVDQPDLW